jgi:hypothetical protein
MGARDSANDVRGASDDTGDVMGASDVIGASDDIVDVMGASDVISVRVAAEAALPVLAAAASCE